MQNGEGELEGGPPGVVLLSVTKEHVHHQAGVQDLTLTYHRDQITALWAPTVLGRPLSCASHSPPETRGFGSYGYQFTCETEARSRFFLF